MKRFATRVLPLLSIVAGCAVDAQDLSLDEDSADGEQAATVSQIDVAGCPGVAANQSFRGGFESFSTNGPFYNACGGAFVIDVASLDAAHATTNASIKIQPFGNTVFPGQSEATACDSIQVESMVYKKDRSGAFVPALSAPVVHRARADYDFQGFFQQCLFTEDFVYIIGPVGQFVNGNSFRVVARASQASDNRGNRVQLGMTFSWFR